MEQNKKEPDWIHVLIGAFVVSGFLYLGLLAGSFLWGVFFYFFEDSFMAGYRFFS